MRRVVKLAAIAAIMLAVAMLMGCAAGSEKFTAEEPAGFWMGLWHGLIVIITFIIGLFTDSVGVYESSNNGNWYDFGYIIGLMISVGGCCRGGRKKRKRKSEREEEWEEIADRVEVKVRRGIKSWLDETEESEREREWEDIGNRIEEKIKRELRDRADS